MKQWFIALSLLAIVTACKPFGGVTTLTNLQYRPTTAGESKRPFLLDLYLPQRTGKKALPLLIYIHGGGWLEFSKEICPAKAFAEQGFAVACINYRYSWEAIFPAQIQDVQEAVRWLKVHASNYGFDRDRIGVFGDSAGGHLSALLGMAGNDARLAGKTAYPTLSPQVQAIVDYYGPTDLTKVPPAFIGAPTRENLAKSKGKPWLIYTRAVYGLLGGAAADHQSLAALANPMTYVDRNDPPILIIHGKADRVVPISQSEIFAKKLSEKGVKIEFRSIPDLHHNYRLENGEMNPVVFDATVDFFKRYLK